MKNKILFLFFIFFAFESFADDDDDDSEDKLLPLSFVGEEKADKRFSNRLVTDIGFNDNYQTTDKDGQYKETFARARFYSKFDFGKNFSFNSQINLSPFNSGTQDNGVVVANSGGNRFFQDEGIFIRQLNLQYNDKKHSFIVGKFNLNYGKAWKWDRGIWGYELANNYRMVDKIGLGTVYRTGNAKKTGQYDFGFSVFKNDRKYLDNSIIAQNDSFTKSDAKAGDSSLLQSYLASMDVSFDFGEKEKLTYNFAYINLAVNSRATAVAQNKLADQKGYVFGMNYLYPVTANYDIDAMVEYNNFENVDGNSDVSERYFTGSVVNKFYRNYLTTLVYSRRSNKNASQLGFEQELSEISVGYEFDKNSFFDRFIIQTGYKNIRNNYKDYIQTNNAFGVLVRYYKNF